MHFNIGTLWNMIKNEKNSLILLTLISLLISGLLQGLCLRSKEEISLLSVSLFFLFHDILVLTSSLYDIYI